MLGSPTKPAEDLYLQLRSVGLDSSRVYRVRDVPIDRAAIHIRLEDGTLAFTKDVAGRVTGAFFEGEGEILLAPPNQLERSSMALFTGAAILEERFLSGYFRFNDDTFAELKPWLRPAENTGEFVSQWNETAQNLASVDALRLLISFSKLLPSAGGSSSSEPLHEERMWHARLQGQRLGPFDAYYDSDAYEQVWAGQAKSVQGENFYDMWSSFAMPASGKPGAAGLANQAVKVDAVNIPNYKIRSEIRLPKALSAEAWLQMDVHQGGQRTVLFELSRFLNLKSVEADGHPIEFIHNQAIEGTQLSRRGNDLVAAIFAQPLSTGEHIELHFVYEGDVLSEAGGGLLYVGARGTWFPNRRLAMSNFDLEFRYPAGWTLVATGKRLQEASAKDNAGELVSRWVSERPFPLAGFNLGKYKSVSARAGDTVVKAYASSGVEQVFPRSSVEISAPPPPNLPPGLRIRDPRVTPPAPPPSPARNAQSVADLSAKAIDFFSRLYGPYPYSTLSLTQQPGAANQGWPGLIFLSSFSFLSEAEKSQLRVDSSALRLSSGVIAHETAHQWWGDLIIWSSYRDQWIVEALADYSSLMFLESEDPRRFRAVLDRYRDDLLEKNQEGRQQLEAGPVTLGLRLSSSKFPNGYETSSYERGAWLFHMLRNMMRDGEVNSTQSRSRRVRLNAANAEEEPFIRALRRVRAQYEGKAVTIDELLSVFESELPPSLWHEGRRSLAWFYEGWINGTSVPRFELQGVKFAPRPGGVLVTGRIVQSDGPNGLVTPVPIYGRVAGKNVALGRVFVDETETNFQLKAPPGTRRVVADPEQTLLTRVR